MHPHILPSLKVLLAGLRVFVAHDPAAARYDTPLCIIKSNDRLPNVLDFFQNHHSLDFLKPLKTPSATSGQTALPIMVCLSE